MPEDNLKVVPPEDTPHDYKRLFEATQHQVKVLEQRLQTYEFHGGVRLYYAINRKLNEMAQVLNNTRLEDVMDGDVKEKKFERIRAIWTDADKIVTTLQSIGAMLNLKGDNEEIDLRKKVAFIESVAKTRP